MLISGKIKYADTFQSPRYGYIWFPSCLIAAAYMYFYLPEVKGRTLEEIDEMVRFGWPR